MAFTFFFRDAQTLELAIDEALPRLCGRAFIHVWDAGCAHGPEPYTVAILLRERMSDYVFRNVRIHATDVDAGFADQVTSGVFPKAEVQRVPPEILKKYFRPADCEACRHAAHGVACRHAAHCVACRHAAQPRVGMEFQQLCSCSPDALRRESMPPDPSTPPDRHAAHGVACRHAAHCVACRHAAQPRVGMESQQPCSCSPDALRRESMPLEASMPSDCACVQVVPELRAKVAFAQHDLLSLRPPREDFSLIVCKNVLLHFDEAQRIAVLRMFHGALQRGGTLVMETTQKLPEALAPCFEQVGPHVQVYRKAEPSLAGRRADETLPGNSCNPFTLSPHRVRRERCSAR